MGLHLIDQVSTTFGSSHEATVFRMATSCHDLAAAGLLRYRLTKAEQRAQFASAGQHRLFLVPSQKPSEFPSPKYRRQSFYTSESCGCEHHVPWNKSLENSSCVYIAGRSTAIQRAREALPNQSDVVGNVEAVRAPYQREDADPVFGDVLFLWWVAP
jgi:hypothetical protein